MRRGFRGATSSYSSFRRLRAGCGVLRMRTSAHWTSRSTTARAAGDLRSSATPRLLRLVRCQGYASFDTGCGGMLFALRQRSPAGGSTLITSAPKSDRITAALGPAMKLARSTTLSPEKMLSPAMNSLLPSPSLELRGALLEERLRPLLLVVRPGAEAEEGCFQGQPFGLARLQSLVHRLERELHGERSVGKDLLQDRLRTRHQLRGGNDLVHEADAVRLLRADRCAGKNQLQRAAFADQPREALCSAATRNDAQRNLGLAELRVLRGDPERAGHGRLATAAERKAIDRGDHRLAEILDQVENRLAERARLFCFDRRDTGQLVDVGSGDERLVAGPCEDDAAHGGVIPRVLERRSEVLPGPPVQGVEHLRTIQRDVGDGALLLVEHV